MSGITTEVKGHLKDERLSTFKSICQQLRVETPEPIQNVLRANDASDFTVPDCDDQKCQLEIQQDINHTTTMSNSLPREHRTVPSIEMCGERSSIVDNFKDLRVISQEYSTECAPHILPLGKSLHDSHASSQDITGKPEVSQDEVYLVWNAQGQSKIELSNKGKCLFRRDGLRAGAYKRREDSELESFLLSYVIHNQPTVFNKAVINLEIR